ncbi:hypothetical protein [Rhizobium sp. Rhizsp42]|uniref:hypothetical protein n=1 Tax=Rhizobium sp. Rhizsp42 TaxID=3243034 RepID=UPI0039AF9618
MMIENQIPAFVEEVASTGCDIVAVLGGFLFGDADLSTEDYELVEPQILAICAKYGRRDHLTKEISHYLVSIGRYYPKEADADGTFGSSKCPGGKLEGLNDKGTWIAMMPGLKRTGPTKL